MTMTTNTYTIRLTDTEVDAVAWATIGFHEVKIVGSIMTIQTYDLAMARRLLAGQAIYVAGSIQRGRILALSRVRRKLEKMVKECGEPIDSSEKEC